jgi:hypothetical protein
MRNLTVKLALLLMLVTTELILVAESKEYNTLRLLQPASQLDASYDYYVQLLQLALNKTSSVPTQFDLIPIKDKNRTNWPRLLNDGLIDIVWSGTSIEREQQAKPIRIPLLRGLLGYRVFLIHQANRSLFEDIQEAKLKKLIACQEAHWPDSEILAQNGYNLLRVTQYQLMFKMVEKRRCDYFPRAIFEARPELINAIQEYPHLAIAETVVLHYQFPVYFFVNHQQNALAEQIELGLRIALNDGSFLALMQQHPAIKHVFPLSQWHNKQFFELHNLTLPSQTPLAEAALWLPLN